VIGTAYTNIGLLASTSYTYRVRAVDAAGNLSKYSGTVGVTTPSGTVTTSTSTVFSTTDAFSGNTTNWQPLTTSRWGVVTDAGNARYALKTTAFSALSGNRLGEYTLVKGKTYADFTLTANVRTTEKLTTNPGADYNVLFGFQDAKNYYYFMYSGTTSYSQLFKVVGGTRITLADATNLAIPDTAYHTVKVERSGSTITVFFDGAKKLEATDTTFMTGRIGIGGYNDAAMWDDIRVTGTVVATTSTPIIGGDELPTSTRTIRVTSQIQLTTAIQAAIPGDHIVLANGEYDKIIVNKQGTADKPIVIRAEKILGAHLRGGFELGVDSKYIWLYGLDLKDASSKLQGENHVIRRVRIWPPFNDGKGSNGLSAYYGSNSRIDYCEIRLYTTDEVLALYGKKWEPDTTYRGVWSYFREGDWFDNLTIERCLLTGGPHDVPYSSPNSQFIEADGSVNVKYTHDIKWRIRNIFGNVPRDRTLIDLKHRGMTLEKVHIISPQGGGIQVRDGNHHTIVESRFEGATISINGEYNTLENTTASAIKLIAGTIPWDSTVTPKSMDHRQTYRTRLSYTSGPLSLGHAYDASNIYPALQTTIEFHSGTINRLNDEGTIISQTSSVPKKTPVTLNSKVVGPNAPWVGISGSDTTPSPTNPAPLAPTTATFSALPTSISAGGTSKLTWTSKNAISCALAPATGMISTAGSVTVSPTKSTTYTLICTGSGGTVTKSVTVTVKTTSVTPPPPPPTSGTAKLMYKNDFDTGWGDVLFTGFCPKRNDSYTTLFMAQGDTIPAGHEQFVRTTAQARSGTYSARVALDPKYACYDEIDRFKIRSEIYMAKSWGSAYKFVDDVDHWYGFSIMIDANSALGNPPYTIMTQIRPGAGISNALKNTGGSWEYGFEGVSGGYSTGLLGAIEKGKWTDFVFHLRPSQTKNGVVEIWINGVKKYSKTGLDYTSTNINGETAIAHSGVYYGNYGTNYPTYGDKNLPFLAYIDSVRIAQGSNGYALVDPSKGANGLGLSSLRTLFSLAPIQWVTVPGYFSDLTANVVSSSSLFDEISFVTEVGSFARTFYNHVLVGMGK